MAAPLQIRPKIRYFIFTFISTVLMTLIQRSEGHGYMIDPPARSSLWRVGFVSPINYNDNALRCGGSRTSCGVCGDPFEGPRDHETGGRFASGRTVRSYTQGADVNIRIIVTANHQGWFYFHLCERNDASQTETEECLNKHPLRLSDGRSRFTLRSQVYGPVNIRVRLPDDVTCSQCVLRWRWVTGNTWGRDEVTGEGCLGCGPQEQFYGCADVNINARGGSGSGSASRPRPPPTVTSKPRPAPAVTNKPLPAVTTKPETPNAGGAGGAVIHPPITQRPGVIVALPDSGLSLKCLAVNNWEGDPELDAWCNANCGGNDPGTPVYCPAVFCSCQLM